MFLYILKYIYKYNYIYIFFKVFFLSSSGLKIAKLAMLWIKLCGL